MAELLEKEEKTERADGTPDQNEASAEVSALSETTSAPPKKKKRNKKKIIRRVITLVVLAGLVGGGIFAWKKFHKDPGDETEVLTDIVQRGSITSTVEGNGAAVAKNSASVTVSASGTVIDVYVTEGDEVTEGTLLYEVDSPEAQQRVTQARETLQKAINNLDDQNRGLKKQQEALQKLLDEPTEADVTADFSGILIDVAKLEPGKKVTQDTDKIATLVDNTRLLLPLYFSYTYENDIYVGQSVDVSIPVVMGQLSGTVHEIHKVERISPEGGKLFEAVIVIDNPGTLTADMAASATIELPEETLYPYESGKLEYFRSKDLFATMTGEISSGPIYDYTPVAAGESIAHIRISGDEREEKIKAQQDQIEDAQRGLESYQAAIEDAQKNLDETTAALEKLTAYAPIDGTVLSLGIHPGDTVTSGTMAVSIADTSTMIVNAMLDEMYVAFAKVGMPVNLSLWGDTQLMGFIESVSLSANSENGISRFPMVISVDNSDGALLSGAYVNYSFTASQSDDCLVVPIQCVKSAQTVDGENCKLLFVQTEEPPELPVELNMETMEIPEGFYPAVVETGISDNYNVEILSGVEEFTTVYAGTSSNESMGGMFF